jgi:hypothetical protein
MRLYRLAAFAAATTLSSCVLFTDACGCVFPSPAAIVFGSVTLATGAPASDATVVASTWHPPCDPLPMNLPTGVNTTTDAQGAYRLGFLTAGEKLQCVRVTARLGSAEDGRVVTVEGRPYVGSEDQLDSVRVDLTLP